jgi:DNA-binding transcriptional regulator YhcF (GntR family)
VAPKPESAASVLRRTAACQACNNGCVAYQLWSLTIHELECKQEQLLILSRRAVDRVVCFLIDMAERLSHKEDVIVLPMSRQDIADYLGLTIETVSRILWNLERRGAIEISDRHSIVLRNHSIVLRNKSRNGTGERLAELFEGVKGRRPKTEDELHEWLVSPEGKAATVFTSFSR